MTLVKHRIDLILPPEAQDPKCGISRRAATALLWIALEGQPCPVSLGWSKVLESACCYDGKGLRNAIYYGRRELGIDGPGRGNGGKPKP